MAEGVLVERRGSEILVFAHGSHSQKGSHSTDSIILRPLHPIVAGFPPNVYSKLLSPRLTTTLVLSRTIKLATWDRNNNPFGLSRIIHQLPPQSQHQTSQIPS